MSSSRRTIVLTVFIFASVAIVYFLIVNGGTYRAGNNKRQKPEPPAKKDKEPVQSKPTPPTPPPPPAPPQKIPFAKRYEKLLKYLKEKGVSMVVDGIIFELQGSMRGVSYVWHHLIPELWMLLKEAPNQFTVIQRGGKNLKNMFGWWEINVVPGDNVGVTQSLNAQKPVAYISSYYGSVPGVCNMLMSYDCFPENVGIPTGPGSEFYGRVTGIQSWANSIISIANSTTRDMINIYEVNPDIIRTTTTRIIGSHYKHVPEAGKAFMAKYGITKPYFYMVGDRTGGKNLQIFFNAISLLRDEERQQFAVVATGGGDFSEQERNWLKGTQAVFIGYVPYEEMPAAYSGALATVYLAYYEGFGMPVVESLACGTPVIAGQEWVLSDEVCLKADKLASSTLVKAIRRALKPNFKSPERIQMSIEEAGRYGSDPEHGWNEMAADILDHLVFGPKRGTECNFLNK